MRKFFILGIAVVLGGAALLIPAGGGAAPIGQLEPFDGRVHHQPLAVTVAVNPCPNGSGGTTPKNDVPLSVLQGGPGVTGIAANQVVATFGGGWSANSASAPNRTFNEYGTKTVSKTNVTIPCSGSGNTRQPTSSVATVTFTSNGTGGTPDVVAVTFSSSGS